MFNIGIEAWVFGNVKIGKIYAYLYKGRLCVGKAVKNPDKKSGYEWAMKNVHTGKFEYPYQMCIIEPDSKFKEVKVKIEYEDARY